MSTGERKKKNDFFFFFSLCFIAPPLEQADQRSTTYIRQAPASGSLGEEREVVLWIAKQNIRYGNVPTNQHPEATFQSYVMLAWARDPESGL